MLDAPSLDSSVVLGNEFSAVPERGAGGGALVSLSKAFADTGPG